MNKSKHVYVTRIFTTIMAIITVFITLGLYSTDVQASDKLYVKGTYNYSGPQQLINDINRDRTSGGAFYFDSNGNKVPATGLKALVYDSSLEKIAEQRAAELVVSYSYTRPNRKSFDTCNSGGISSNQEYIFKDTSVKTGDQMYDVWFAYGHGGAAASMMYPYFQSVAAACFTYNGNTYWVLEFSVNTTNSSFSTTSTSDIGGNYVEYDTNYFTPIYKLTGGENSFECYVGDKVEINKKNYTLETYRGEALESTVTLYSASSYYPSTLIASISSIN